MTTNRDELVKLKSEAINTGKSNKSINSICYIPHQGKRECKRRLMQETRSIREEIDKLLRPKN